MTPLQALAELVALKDLKDRIDSWGPQSASDAVAFWAAKDDYARRKPLAWAAARAVLAQGEGQPKPEGVAVHLFGDFRPIAWFAEFDDLAEAWCREHAFGQWLTWRSTAPVMIPLTPEESAECERRGKELAAKLTPKDPTP